MIIALYSAFVTKCLTNHECLSMLLLRQCRRTSIIKFRCSRISSQQGWFDRFVKRNQLQIGEPHGEAASVDTEVAEKYPDTSK
ncbi:hypothetical protein NPIL_7881 [Nephila pilipes]|uniref:HTH CENPB-type domain-containing protein n=1 Tax=Nephila pilipes TaxID=299642 RepID=A0A8X6TA38_NEPPI|nr:hypothetical protein NPIL_7881 [Nephila pilipes]